MSVTSPPSQQRLGAELVELFGSMRFAISLLVFICVASVIGTVLPQSQALGTYMDQFGPFWVALFDRFAIWHVYNSWWFLLIMAFLVVSTTLCLLRNTPKMLRDMRSFREHVRGSSLRAFPHRVEANLAVPVDTSSDRISDYLQSQGYKIKHRVDGDSVMLAAKKGSSNKLGYIFAHVAIVVICIGGLLDSELPVRLQVWFGGKAPVTENMLISAVPASGRLAMNNVSFRGNMMLPEGTESRSAIIAVDEGVLVQPMPFSIRLNRFLVEYYSTGMPSSFKSEVEVTDTDTGETFQQTIEVNEPLRFKGLTVYQASLEDGGSRVKLMGYPLQGTVAKPFDLAGVVGESMELGFGPEGRKETLQVKFSDFRPINVENLAANELPRPRQVIEHVAAVTGSNVGGNQDNLVNIGPSIEYQLIGRDGQSHEFLNYMAPITLDDSPVFLTGVRETPAQEYRYLRIPADANYSINEFMSLRAALGDADMVAQAAARFSQRHDVGNLEPEVLQRAAQGALDTFGRGGFEALIQQAPEQERGKILEFAVPMIQLSLAELRKLQREKDGIEPLPTEGPEAQAAERWLQLALLAFANLPEYPAPVFLQLQDFDHVQASVFQIARSPGTSIVYLGCLFLMIGIFAMFYIHDRRIWVWIQPETEGSRATMAMTSQRRTLDFEHEFERHKAAFGTLSN